eukprot:jgi/Botrbrau1/2754/Bobra.0164s0033.1
MRAARDSCGEELNACQPQRLHEVLFHALSPDNPAMKGVLRGPDRATSSATEPCGVSNLPFDRQRRTVQTTLSLLHTLQHHIPGQQSGDLLLFNKVLQGSVGLELWEVTRKLLNDLNECLTALGGGSLTGAAARSDVERMLSQLLPGIEGGRLSSYLPPGRGDINLQDIAADTRFGGPSASNVFTSRLVEAITQRALDEASAVQKALNTLSPDRTTLVQFADLCSLLEPTLCDGEECVRAAWSVGEQRGGGTISATNKRLLAPDLVAFGFRAVRMPVCRRFWNRALGMAFCETLHADTSGSRSQAGLPPGA